MAVPLSNDDDDMQRFQFGGTLSAEQAATIIAATSGPDGVFASYTKNQITFPSFLKYVSPERLFHIQAEIDREITNEIQVLRGKDARKFYATVKERVSPSERRQQHIQRSNRAIQCLFEREHVKYAKLDNEYWEILQTPFPPKFSMIEAYKKREKLLQIHIGDCQARLDELFRRKLISEATKGQPVAFSAPRKQTKVFKARR
uniref:Uncharacterized protein n=1 Tax=Panagrolaimus sp. ES5 TaxID=591445 RepID=A0AC34G179_9BILA